MNKAFFNWSGGKDSALALYHALQLKDFQIDSLFTSINAHNMRISMHGVKLDVLEKQTTAIGLPLKTLELPGEISMDDYNALMSNKLSELKREGISHTFFGDIFLEDLKKYREEQLMNVGMKAHFPIWKRDTSELLKEFWALGFRTIIVAADGSKLDQTFIGRELDEQCVRDFPSNVDPCGENGEFHTFVFDGPIFKHPISFIKKEVVKKSYKLSKDSKEEVIYYFQELDVN